MELLKLDERPAEYKWKDVTFLINTKMTTGKKWNIVISSTNRDKDSVQFSPWEYYVTMIKTFVSGWRGVTENGKDVPYSFETLMDRLPSGTDDNLIMQLGLHIAELMGFIPRSKETELKNG